jgi:hypothetical protein
VSFYRNAASVTSIGGQHLVSSIRAIDPDDPETVGDILEEARKIVLACQEIGANL